MRCQWSVNGSFVFSTIHILSSEFRWQTNGINIYHHFVAHSLSNRVNAIVNVYYTFPPWRSIFLYDLSASMNFSHLHFISMPWNVKWLKSKAPYATPLSNMEAVVSNANIYPFFSEARPASHLQSTWLSQIENLYWFCVNIQRQIPSRKRQAKHNVANRNDSTLKLMACA